MKCDIVTHKVVKGDGQGRVNYEMAWEVIKQKYHLTISVGVSELVNSNDGFSITNPDDVDSLIKSIQKLEQNTGLRHQMSKTAHAHPEKHNWTRMDQQYLDLIEEDRKT